MIEPMTDNLVKRIIKEKLKKARNKKGISQEEMAERLGYKDKSSYCHIENGNVKITIETAKKIADILEENVNQLFFTQDVEAN